MPKFNEYTLWWLQDGSIKTNAQIIFIHKELTLNYAFGGWGGYARYMPLSMIFPCVLFMSIRETRIYRKCFFNLVNTWVVSNSPQRKAQGCESRDVSIFDLCQNCNSKQHTWYNYCRTMDIKAYKGEQANSVLNMNHPWAGRPSLESKHACWNRIYIFNTSLEIGLKILFWSLAFDLLKGGKC